MNQHVEDMRGSGDNSQLQLFWFRWVAISTLAAALGWFLAVFGFLFTLGLSSLLAGPIVGILVGWAQERVLRSRFPKVNWHSWLVRTALGMSAAWFTFLVLYILADALGGLVFRDSLLPRLLGKLVALVIAGSALGLIQGGGVIDLGGKRRWVICNATGWAIAGLVGPVLASPFVESPVRYVPSFLIPDAIYFLVLGTLSVLVVNILTATTLVLLIKGQGTETAAL